MLTIFNLHARVDDKEILRGINLKVNAGEVHAIMGPNGSGKSTLAGVLAGRDAYEVTEGEVLFDGKDLLDMDPEERAREGVFLAFQYPVEIPGVSNTLLPPGGRSTPSASTAASRSWTPRSSSSSSRQKMKLLHIERRPAQAAGQRGLLRRREETQRDLPDGRARPEAGHPRRDRLRPGHRRPAHRGRRRQRPAEQGPGHPVITHYQRLLNYIVPDYVHVLVDGRIVKSGGKELALELEEKGYEEYGWSNAEVARAAAGEGDGRRLASRMLDERAARLRRAHAP